MSDGLDPRIEGRLLALRQMLAMLAAGQPPQALLDAAERSDTSSDEDPGALPSEVYALEHAVAEERAAFARELRLRLGK